MSRKLSAADLTACGALGVKMFLVSRTEVRNTAPRFAFEVHTVSQSHGLFIFVYITHSSVSAAPGQTMDTTMLLKNVFIRFYKSFNYDYMRKFHPNAEKRAWESFREDEFWYPHVTIPLDPHVTTVVGANESGKSQLLSAIEKGISGDRIERSDFCRYSQFFTVEREKMGWPEFGFEWELNDADRKAVQESLDLPTGVRDVDRLLMFRTDRTKWSAYVPLGKGYSECPINEESKLLKLLPRVFHINAGVGLPESVPIRFLAGMSDKPSWFERMGRRSRVGLNDQIAGHSDWFVNEESVKTSASSIAAAVSDFFGPDVAAESMGRTEELQLAKQLLCQIADIDTEAFVELHKALAKEKDAYVNGMIQEMNSALAKKLNFPKWWVQDKDFQLVLSPRECDIVFTIRDRTGSEYAFNERSSGLKYFLSYYIQYLAYAAEEDGATPEILLMDEPDAYLSSQGQQDLLKLFAAFSEPPIKGRPPVQVVYVTHSPFLIDKNHASRIRVLEKGVDDEGTRVVRNVSKNHYEPLRSAFGAFVGETTFIGNCNLVVEGPADQILLAGVSTFLRSRGAKRATLDLNHVTIVPAGSASHIPYIVYLARGRDVVQPAVIVLLDSDKAGNEAAEGLKRGGPRNKQILNPSFVLQVADLPQDKSGVRLAAKQTLFETEDLIPLEIGAAAVRLYFKDVFGVDENTSGITAKSLQKRLNKETPAFDAIQAELATLEPPLHIEKMGFARSVMDVVNQNATADPESEMGKAIKNFGHNMTILMAELTRLQREAERDLRKERVSSKIERLKDAFLQDHVDAATREDGGILLEDVEATLDDTTDSDAIRIVLQQIKREHALDREVTRPIDSFDEFRQRLEQLRYAGRLVTQVSGEESSDSVSVAPSVEAHVQEDLGTSDEL